VLLYSTYQAFEPVKKRIEAVQNAAHP